MSTDSFGNILYWVQRKAEEMSLGSYTGHKLQQLVFQTFNI